ncbi:MAG: purine-nucleoside phosphorylase [Ignavibacteriaceae bacterium]|nr:purine-nucleoside phosphorylase [Ignavibacteriaceae bacterium]
MKIDLKFKYQALLTKIRNEAPFQPEVAIVLGSGLGNFASSVNIIKSFNTSALPGYPPSTIKGHEGKIHFSEYDGKKLLLFQGRIHFYEGYNISECILPSFIARQLKCKYLLLTNAAGGVNPNFVPGDLMLNRSIDSFNIKKELTNLIGLADETGKNNFNNFPSAFLNGLIKKAALEEKIELKEGVYWFNKGPAYETPAEIRMMGKFGADAVGMSTVHEAIFAAYLGIKTSSITCVTNFAAGITGQKLSHEEVTVTAKLVEDKFERLVKRTILLID